MEEIMSFLLSLSGIILFFKSTINFFYSIYALFRIHNYTQKGIQSIGNKAEIIKKNGETNPVIQMNYYCEGLEITGFLDSCFSMKEKNLFKAFNHNEHYAIIINPKDNRIFITKNHISKYIYKYLFNLPLCAISIMLAVFLMYICFIFIPEFLF